MMQKNNPTKKGDTHSYLNAVGREEVSTCIGFVVETSYNSEGHLLPNQPLNNKGDLWHRHNEQEKLYLAPDRETAMRFVQKHSQKHEYPVTVRPYWRITFK